MLVLRFALSRYIVDLKIHGERSVWEARNCWKGPYNVKALVIFYFSYLHYNNIFVSHKIGLILLYGFLITYIGFVEYTLFLSLHWLVSFYRFNIP
jgi:hypothetical protein